MRINLSFSPRFYGLALALTSALALAACGSTTPATGSSSGASSGGAGDGGTGDGGTEPDPFAGPSVCTSGKTFTGRQGDNMRPGEACVACHKAQRVPRLFAFAGTVYPTGHEPNDCVGTTEGTLAVIITDVNKKEVSIPVNAANNGNFSLLTTTLTAPYSVRVENTSTGKARAMSRTLAAGEGDCNSCHTETGTNSAPGRIVAP
jgi:hypothetical protein